MHLFRSLLASAAIVVLATPATAATYQFTFDGVDQATWELPASPVPDVVLGEAFRINDVSGILNGSPFTAFMEFYVAGSGGGVCVDIFCDLLDLYGPQLFSGTLASPTFILGVFSMTDFFGNTIGRLIISEATSTVPEPGTLAMMLAGLGFIGAGLRRRRTIVAA